ncbi:hypothetical protein KAR91_36235 [Candidatus Pacearchaeota archaeon]|nr:hypothetical protein [Candidatus Pacearchaeota archaeon]
MSRNFHKFNAIKKYRGMDMKGVLCWIGLHSWKEQLTVEWHYEYGGILFFTGDVCQRCGKHKHDPAKYTEGLPQNYTVLGVK